MTIPESTPGHIELLPATEADEQLLANLLALYIHDLSEFVDLPIPIDGRFSYPWLGLYWREPDRTALLIKVSGDLAGFVLVSRGSRIREDKEIWDVAEFFVLRGFRRRGVGASAAAMVWQRFPGKWEVRVRENNSPAHAFWGDTIRNFTSPVNEEFVSRGDVSWHVFTFASPEAG